MPLLETRRLGSLQGREEGFITPERSNRRGDLAEVTFATVDGPHRVRLERTLGASMRLTCHASHEDAPPVWLVLGIERADD